MTNEEVVRRLAEINARVEATTPGDWEYEDVMFGQYLVWAGDIIVMGEYGGSTAPSPNDAEFCAHAKWDIQWLLEQDKELEAACARNWNGFVAESRCSARADKWARRWKLAAKWERWRAYEQSRLVSSEYDAKLTLMKRGWEKDKRIAALENAARSCVTCVYYTSDLEPIPEYCNKHCRKPDVRHAGWQFDEKRWAPKGEKQDE